MTLTLFLLGVLTLAVFAISVGVWLWRLADRPAADTITRVLVDPAVPLPPRSVIQRRSGRWHRSATVED
jgi:hypothetical protein